MSSAVRDPSGKIATAMKELGYLSPEQSVDDAARKLSEEKIKAVLEKAYAIQDSAVSPSETPVHVPAAPDPVSAAPVTPSAKTAPVVPPVPPSVQLPSEAPKTGFSILGWLSLGAVAGAGWIFFRRSKLVKNSGRTEVSKSPVVEIQPETEVPSAVQPSTPAVIRRRPRAPLPVREIPQFGDEVSVTPPRDVESPAPHPAQAPAENLDVGRFEGARKAAFKKMHDHMVRSLGFSVDSDLSQAGENFMGTLGFSETVPTGSKFSLVVTTREASVELSARCEDGGRSVFSKSASLDFPSVGASEGDFERNLQSAADALLKSALEARHAFKYEEFRNVSRFEVTRSDFAEIYRQLSVPEIVRSNRETG